MEGEQRTREVHEKAQIEEQVEATVSADMACNLGDKDTGPKQLKLPQYPRDQFGIQKRAFQSNWFQSFTWLEYSLRRNAAFCFACRVFGKRLKQEEFVNGGIKNWKHALSMFQKHETTQCHKDSVLCWHSYKASKSTGSVLQQI